MSQPEQGSGRWSGRVEPILANREASGLLLSRKPPESLSPARSRLRAAERTGRRVTERRLTRLESDLSGRERAVLEAVAGYRYLTTGQLQRLHFADHATEGAASRI